jgi:hypothetical protein
MPFLLYILYMVNLKRLSATGHSCWQALCSNRSWRELWRPSHCVAARSRTIKRIPNSGCQRKAQLCIQLQVPLSLSTPTRSRKMFLHCHDKMAGRLVRCSSSVTSHWLDDSPLHVKQIAAHSLISHCTSNVSQYSSVSILTLLTLIS